MGNICNIYFKIYTFIVGSFDVSETIILPLAPRAMLLSKISIRLADTCQRTEWKLKFKKKNAVKRCSFSRVDLRLTSTVRHIEV